MSPSYEEINSRGSEGIPYLSAFMVTTPCPPSLLMTATISHAHSNITQVSQDPVCVCVCVCK